MQQHAHQQQQHQHAGCTQPAEIQRPVPVTTTAGGFTPCISSGAAEAAAGAETGVAERNGSAKAPARRNAQSYCRITQVFLISGFSSCFFSLVNYIYILNCSLLFCRQENCSKTFKSEFKNGERYYSLSCLTDKMQITWLLHSEDENRIFSVPFRFCLAVKIL